MRSTPSSSPASRRLSVRSLVLLGSLVVLTTVVPSAPALGAAEPPADDQGGVNAPHVMPDYSAEDFRLQAESMPADLAEAVERDLGEEPADYLARAAAGVAAADVVDDLAERGIDIAGSRLEGTDLVVNVGSENDVEVVEAAGARADLNPPLAGPDVSGIRLDALADLEGGQPYTFSTLAGGKRLTYACSAAFNGVDVSSRQAQFLTAGHCIAPDRTDGGVYFEARQTSAGALPYRGSLIGTPLESTFQFGSGADSGLVATDGGWSPKAAVAVWGGSRGAVGDGDPVVVRDVATGVVGAPLCKSGRQSGWTCGEILETNYPAQVYNQQGAPVIVNATLTSACMLQGDSGSAGVIGSSAFGVGSSGSFAGDCVDPSSAEISAFFPLRTSDGTASVASTSPSWEPLVSVADPTVVVPTFVGDSIRGTVAGGGPRHRVTVKIGTSAILTATPAADGNWSVPVPSSLSTGRHDFTVQAGWGRTASSAVVSSSYDLARRPSVERISGPDRYAVAVSVSQRAFPGTAPVVLVATGSNYPDALSAAPAAVQLGGPLLLTPRDGLPDMTKAELRRLQPRAIVVVGGPASVSESVLTELRAIAPDVSRVSGADRYEASRNIADLAFGAPGAAFVATGANYPDALSASAAAGSKGAPVLLVDGGAASADAATLGLLNELQIRSITIAGGPNSVSTGVEASLSARASVVRLAGPDRFSASVSINRGTFTTAGTVYLATGYNYPDALAGGVLAGMSDSPLFVVPTTCVPQDVLSQIRTLGATRVVLLGGPVSLTEGVAGLVSCG